MFDAGDLDCYAARSTLALSRSQQRASYYENAPQSVALMPAAFHVTVSHVLTLAVSCAALSLLITEFRPALTTWLLISFSNIIDKLAALLFGLGDTCYERCWRASEFSFQEARRREQLMLTRFFFELISCQCLLQRSVL